MLNLILLTVISGELTHRDSLSNLETLKRGDLQMTSTGTGIKHSEYNDNKKEEVHFLQVSNFLSTRIPANSHCGCGC